MAEGPVQKLQTLVTNLELLRELEETMRTRQLAGLLAEPDLMLMTSARVNAELAYLVAQWEHAQRKAIDSPEKLSKQRELEKKLQPVAADGDIAQRTRTMSASDAATTCGAEG